MDAEIIEGLVNEITADKINIVNLTDRVTALEKLTDDLLALVAELVGN